MAGAAAILVNGKSMAPLVATMRRRLAQEVYARAVSGFALVMCGQ